MLLRTAKSCGPDAPTLASSSRMASRPYRAQARYIRWRRWQTSPVTGESAKETVKTIACGNAGRFPVCSLLLVCLLPLQVHTRPRVQRAPGIPHALFGRELLQRLGRIASRGRSRIWCLTIESAIVVPAKAGTQNHRRWLRQKASNCAPKTIGHGVWVPARASLGRDDGGAESAHSRYDGFEISCLAV